MTHETTAPVQSLVDEVLAEIDQSAAFHRELNTNNYDHDDVCSLNDWGVDACTALEKVAKLIRQQQALLARQAAPVAVPEGWKLVPVDPTEEMALAYRYGSPLQNRRAYRAMIAAAPTQPAQQIQWVPEEWRELVSVLAREAARYDDVAGIHIDDSLELWQQPRATPAVTVGHLRKARALISTAGDTAPPAPEQADSQDELREEIGGLKSVNTMLVQALKRLTFHARTTGGTAGPDAGLMEACEQAEHALSFGGFGRAYMEGADAEPEQAGQDAVTVPRELIERIVIAASQCDGPALHEAVDELRALLEGGK